MKSVRLHCNNVFVDLTMHNVQYCIPNILILPTNKNVPLIGLLTVLEAILTSRQPREKSQCLYENLMSNNFRKTTVLKKI